MIKLNQLSRVWGLLNVSPACMELETWLRLTGVPYEISPLDFLGAPKGKIPYIEENGTKLGDATLIIAHLAKSRGKELDERLTPMDRAISVAFRRLLKENLYWVLV